MQDAAEIPRRFVLVTRPAGEAEEATLYISTGPQGALPQKVVLRKD